MIYIVLLGLEIITNDQIFFCMLTFDLKFCSLVFKYTTLYFISSETWVFRNTLPHLLERGQGQ